MNTAQVTLTLTHQQLEQVFHLLNNMPSDSHTEPSQPDLPQEVQSPTKTPAEPVTMQYEPEILQKYAKMPTFGRTLEQLAAHEDKEAKTYNTKVSTLIKQKEKQETIDDAITEIADIKTTTQPTFPNLKKPF